MNLFCDLMGQEYAGLAWQFHVSPSSCGNPDFYDSYIRFSAVADMTDGNSVTHVLIDRDENKMAAYFALRVCSMCFTGTDGKQIGLPALEIAEIAIAGEYERKGIGSFIISSVIAIAKDIRENAAGVKYIVACADPAAIGFYKKQGFNVAGDVYELPRDGSNNNCIPAYLRF